MSLVPFCALGRVPMPRRLLLTRRRRCRLDLVRPGAVAHAEAVDRCCLAPGAAPLLIMHSSAFHILTHTGQVTTKKECLPLVDLNFSV